MKPRYLFWGLLLFDVTFQILHFGGMTFLDQVIHCMFLSLASGVLVWLGRFRSFPWFLWLPMVLLFAGALFQLIPFPKPMIQFLNPTKIELAKLVRDAFSASVDIRQISLLPNYHRIRLSSWVLDGWFLALVVVGPHFSKKKLYYWVGWLSLTLSSVLLINASGKMNLGLEAYISGPGNVNQIAGFLVFLTAIGCGLIFTDIVRIRRSFNRTLNRRIPILSATIIGLVLNLFALFQLGSRAGFLLAIVLLFSLPFWWLFDNRQRMWGIIGSVFLCMAVLIMMFNMDSKKLASKFQRKGLFDKARQEIMTIGLKELWPPAPLGQGLGSSSALIGHRFASGPKTRFEMTEFHNDWIQILVEMGLFGLVFLVFFGYWVIRIWIKTLHAKSLGERNFYLSIGVVLVLLGIQSLVSFPMRIIGIRLFAFLMIGLCLKAKDHKMGSLKSRCFGVLLVFASVGAFFVLNLERIEYLNDPNPIVARAANYGTIHNIPLYQANEAKSLIISSLYPENGTSLLKDTRRLAVHALEMKPTSLQAMNLVFLVDLIGAGQTIDRQTFDRFKSKAIFIHRFGHPLNKNAPLAKLLLYQSFPGLLSDEEKGELFDMEQAYERPLRRARNLLP